MGLGAKWSAQAEIAQLASPRIRCSRSRTATTAQATGELTGQIQSLEDVIDDLGERATLAPEQARAMQKLPAVVKARAGGGVTDPNRAISDVVSSLSPLSPEDTFGVLRDLLRRARKPAQLRAPHRRDDAKRWPPRRRPSGRRTAG